MSETGAKLDQIQNTLNTLESAVRNREEWIPDFEVLTTTARLNVQIIRDQTTVNVDVSVEPSIPPTHGHTAPEGDVVDSEATELPAEDELTA